VRYLTLLLMLLALGVAGCGDDDDDNGDSGSATSNDTQAQTETVVKPPVEKVGGCVKVAQPEAKPDGGGGEKPTEPLSGDYEVTFKTNCGSFTVEIDEEIGGLTAASFVHLADSGFYKNTIFHRVVPGFVIQGGDPTGSGLGGPGYTTHDPPPSDATYPVGTVAMAKAGPEPPGTAGSQFFVATGPGLTPDYAIVGKVVSGLDVVNKVDKFGDPTDPAGTPTQIVKIEKTTVTGP
jgi:cyclophilin family peptidyl-prolyl cis-trans isomerase